MLEYATVSMWMLSIGTCVMKAGVLPDPVKTRVLEKVPTAHWTGFC